MTNPENRNIVEMHGCIVCARLFNILVVYSPDGKILDCAVTSPEGHLVLNEQQPLVACNIHPAEKIEAAYKRWQSKNGKEQGDE